MARTPPSSVRGIVTRTSVSAVLVLLTLIAAAVFAQGTLFALDRGVGRLGDGLELVVSLVATQLTIAVVAVLFLRTVVGWESVSVDRPTREVTVTVAVGAGLAASVDVLRRLAIAFTSLDAASTLPVDEGIGTAAIVLVVAGTIVLAPLAEELLFRGGVQTYVAGASSNGVGIAVATVLFVPIHSFGVLATAPNAAAAVAAFLPVAALSVAAGVAYARTNTVLVPILLHGSYNVLAALVVPGLAFVLRTAL